jgi:integrase
MKPTSSRNKPRAEWPQTIRHGLIKIKVYRRLTPSGNPNFMIADTVTEPGKRKFISFPDEAAALAEAASMARKQSELGTMAQQITTAQAADYVNAVNELKPFNVTLPQAVSTVTQALKIVGSLAVVIEAIKFYAQRHRKVTDKRVPDVVTELLKIKTARKASARYLKDLDSRLGTFAASFQTDIASVTTPQIQNWLDGLNLSAQTVRNFRTVLNLLFEFAIARGYAVDNPVAGVEKVKVNGGAIEIYTPAEIERLLAAASPEFLPCVALGAFAGLRSAEIERLEWSDIRLAEKFIVIGADKAKTASRRIVPVADNLAAWLAPYAEKTGKVWAGSSIGFYKAEQKTAAATEIKGNNDKGFKSLKPVKWKANGLRHSAASYWFAGCNDAGRVAGYLGNSATVIHRHYRELVTPADAVKWFSIMPERAANVLPMPQAVASLG